MQFHVVCYHGNPPLADSFYSRLLIKCIALIGLIGWCMLFSSILNQSEAKCILKVEDASAFGLPSNSALVIETTTH
jgi:hypothetical protein